MLRGGTADTAHLPDVSSLILPYKWIQQSLFNTKRQRDTFRLTYLRKTHPQPAVLDNIPASIDRASYAEYEDCANCRRCASPVIEVEFGNVSKARPCHLETGFGEWRHRFLRLNE